MILAASILSLSLSRSLSSYYQWTVMILRMPPAGRLHASIGFIRGNNRAAIFTRVDWTRCSIDPFAPSGRSALVLESFDPWSRNKKSFNDSLNVRIGHARDLDPESFAYTPKRRLTFQWSHLGWKVVPSSSPSKEEILGALSTYLSKLITKSFYPTSLSTSLIRRSKKPTTSSCCHSSPSIPPSVSQTGFSSNVGSVNTKSCSTFS